MYTVNGSKGYTLARRDQPGVCGGTLHNYHSILPASYGFRSNDYTVYVRALEYARRYQRSSSKRWL